MITIKSENHLQRVIIDLKYINTISILEVNIKLI